MQTTALDLIASALRLIGVQASGEAVDAATAADSLFVLNSMLDTWSAERLMIPALVRVVTDSLSNPIRLAARQQVYTLGTGGQINIPRPPEIQQYGVISLTNALQPLELLLDILTIEQFALLPVKNVPTSLPTSVYNDSAFPLMHLTFWPIPNVIVGLALYVWSPITSFADLVTQYGFQPAYIECIRYNLAVRLLAEFPGNFSQMVLATVPALAASTKAIVKSFNTPTFYMTCDPALTTQGGTWSYLTGDFIRTGGR